jgi:hypothetical protein
MSIARYNRYPAASTGREEIAFPTWSQVETAVRRMENYCFPFVSLSVDNDPYDDRLEAFWIIGGNGRWAMRQSALDGWEYEMAGGGEEDVRLWESDQGYFCKAKNIVTDIEEVLRVTREFYESGSYAGLGPVTGA